MTREDALALIDKFTRDSGPVPELDPVAIARLLVVIVSDPSIRDVDALRHLQQSTPLD
jgi:hypothetical protein